MWALKFLIARLLVHAAVALIAYVAQTSILFQSMWSVKRLRSLLAPTGSRATRAMEKASKAFEFSPPGRSHQNAPRSLVPSRDIFATEADEAPTIYQGA